MDTDGKLRLLKGYNRLSRENRAEIIGMVEALTFAQMGEEEGALVCIDALDKARGRDAERKAGP